MIVPALWSGSPGPHEWPLRVVDCPSCGLRSYPKPVLNGGPAVEWRTASTCAACGRKLAWLEAGSWRPGAVASSSRPTKDRVSMFRSLQGLGAPSPRTGPAFGRKKDRTLGA
jgi:endogenous inhibitor of DNA gyrase (YacG/DUF329 family)